MHVHLNYIILLIIQMYIKFVEEKKLFYIDIIFINLNSFNVFCDEKKKDK